MLRISLAPIALLVFAGSANSASNCEAIRSQIDAKIRAGGVAHFTLTTVDADAKTSAIAKVVGTCELGTKKIVYEVQDMQDMQDVPASSGSGDSPSSGRSAPAHLRGEAILTECKDGSVSVGGDCRR